MYHMTVVPTNAEQRTNDEQPEQARADGGVVLKPNYGYLGGCN